MGALGMKESDLRPLSPVPWSPIEKRDSSRGKEVQLLLKVLHLERNMVDPLTSFVQKLGNGVVRTDALHQFHFGVAKGEEGDLNLLLLKDLHRVSSQAQVLLEELTCRFQVPDHDCDVGYALNHR